MREGISPPTAIEPLEQKLARRWPPEAWCDVTVLVAVSGGPDSVALLRALAAIRTPGPGKIVAGHFNHRLRGSQSDGDEAFVRELCHSLGFACEVGHADAAVVSGSMSEAVARSGRHGFFAAAAGRCGARYVTTGHTADDQAETILHRVLRGTSLAGLAGMRRSRPLVPGVTLIRPLLGVRRAELLAYLREIGQGFREDASNRDCRFTRNRLRHDLLPRLADQYNPRVVEALARLGQLAGEADDCIAGLVAEIAMRAVRFEPGRLVFDCTMLAREPRFLVRETLLRTWRKQGCPEQAMGFAEWDQLAELISAPGPSSAPPRCLTLPGGVTARRDEESLVIEGAEFCDSFFPT
jgi:tRNA(Ile)-lysidine synthase